jgi:hypothetical protein
MPKKEIDYSKTIIYKIVCNDLSITDLYIGSTTDFTKRKNSHKSRCNNVNSKSYNFNIYQKIRDNGGWCNWSMIQIEIFSCNNGNEARARERYWFENLNSKLNMVNPKRNDKEYYEDNKEKIKLNVKKWCDDNKDKVKEYRNEYYQKNKQIYQEKYICECCNKEISLGSKIKHNKTFKHINNLQSLI